MKRLFLDDWRIPVDCATYMYNRTDFRIYHKDWIVVRSYGDFGKWIKDNGIPDVVSFDYDLCDVVELKEELPIEYNGLDCAILLKNYCVENNLKLPEIIIYSANPDGCEKLKKYLSL